MTEQNEIRGSMEGSVRNAKAAFPKIDPHRLSAFIEAQPEIQGSVELDNLAYPVDGAGASNGILLFSATLDRGAGRERLELVLRYSPGNQLLKQKSYTTEVETLRAVERAGLPAPKALWLDPEGAALGYAGFVMERVFGETPSAAMYSKGPLANVTPDVRRELMLKAAGFHGRLRKAAIGADRAPHLAHRGEGGTAIERELNWWFEEVRLVWPEGDAKLKRIGELREWLVKHQPRDLYKPGLVHGDAQIANMIYRDGEIAAVLDWELSYLGHNESDLALIVFLTESQNLTDVEVEGTPTEQEYIARFETESGRPVQHWPYFKLMSMYRVVSVSSLSAEIMPSFEAVWAFFSRFMERDWAEAMAVYESN